MLTGRFWPVDRTFDTPAPVTLEHAWLGYIMHCVKWENKTAELIFTLLFKHLFLNTFSYVSYYFNMNLHIIVLLKLKKKIHSRTMMLSLSQFHNLVSAYLPTGHFLFRKFLFKNVSMDFSFPPVRQE